MNGENSEFLWKLGFEVNKRETLSKFRESKKQEGNVK